MATRRWVKPYLIQQAGKRLKEQGCAPKLARRLVIEMWRGRAPSQEELGWELAECLDYLLIGDVYTNGDINATRIKEGLASTLARLPKTVFDKLQRFKVIYLIASSSGMVTTHTWPKTLQVGEEVHIVSLSEELAGLESDIITGVIAHELAHVVLRHGHRPPMAIAKSLEERIEIAKTHIEMQRKEAPNWEEEADRAAIGWGFKDEIVAMRALG